MFCTCSVLINPGLIKVFQTFVGKAVVIGSRVFLSGIGRVKRYGIVSEESYVDQHKVQV